MLKLERDKKYIDTDGDVWQVAYIESRLPDEYNCLAFMVDKSRSVTWFSIEGKNRVETQFNLIREHREPREFYVEVARNGEVVGCSNNRPLTVTIATTEVIKVREVLE